jgi:hypothetical protein
LAGCGGAHHGPLPVAQLSHSSISRAEFNLNVAYSERYFAGLGEISGGSATFRCAGSQVSTPCSRVRQQVLGRLIEEHAILDYARLHHIRLSLADRIRVSEETQSLVALRGGRSWPFSSSRQNNAFFRQLVTRELLVRTVEEAVVPESLTHGLMLHVRKFVLPVASATESHAVYRQAVDLATDGKPVPASALVRTEWVAPFRIKPSLRQALLDARPGQFTGPFGHGDAYQVIQLLGKEYRRYGKPARTSIELGYFRRWLRRAVQAERPNCFTSQGHTMACPAEND